jgi:hypothetical protein
MHTHINACMDAYVIHKNYRRSNCSTNFGRKAAPYAVTSILYFRNLHSPYIQFIQMQTCVKNMPAITRVSNFFILQLMQWDYDELSSSRMTDIRQNKVSPLLRT